MDDRPTIPRAPRAARTWAHPPARPGRAKRLIAVLGDSLLGDFLGAAALFVLLWSFLVFTGALS